MARVRQHTFAPAIALATVLVAFALPLLASPARAGTAVVFIEDFESGAIGSRWSSTDNNPASGLDHWDVTNYRAHAGNYSAWSAQVGTQSGTGLNNSAVRQYDNDMQADLAINLSASGFTSLTLSFWYWSRAEAGGGDFLEAWYVAGGVPTMIFQNRGTASWTAISLAVPTNVEQLVLRLTTDAANNNFEGAYVDDIVMTGTESNPPTSSAAPLPTYVNTATVNVAFSAADGVNESGVDFVELWYRPGTSGNFSLYTRPSNPTGQWIASPARFDVTYALGDGYYEFFTIAVDYAQNREAPPGTPDASTTIDTEAPTLTVTAPAGNAWIRTADVRARWQGGDAGTGLDRYETRLDGGAFAGVGLATQQDFTGLADGDHSVAVRAYDLAGNVAEVSVAFRVDTTAPATSIEAPTIDVVLHDSDVTVTWSSTDAGSGVDHFEVWIDGGTPEVTTGLEWTFPDIGDGPHTVHVRAYDVAGNSAEVSVTFRVSTGIFSWDGPYGPFPLLLLILIVALVLAWFLLAWWKRREEQEDEALAKAGEEPAAGEPPETHPEDEETGPPPPEGG